MHWIVPVQMTSAIGRLQDLKTVLAIVTDALEEIVEGFPLKIAFAEKHCCFIKHK